MKKLLVINSSARTQRSHSREMTATFVENWKERQPDSPITFRELGKINVPYMTEEWISAAFKPAASRTEEDVLALGISDIFVSELKEADVIVIGAPMYNWSIPSPLKAYIDQVMRIYETWKPNPADKAHPYTGLLQNKTLVLLLARGAAGYEPGEYNEHMNFQSTYLKTIFNIMGISDIHVISINGASRPSDELTSSVENSKKEIKAFVERHLEPDHSTHPIINY